MFAATSNNPDFYEALTAVLPPSSIDLHVVPRREEGGAPISASHVRQLIHDGRIGEIRPLVPETTYAYLTGPQGAAAVARIRASQDVIHH